MLRFFVAVGACVVASITACPALADEPAPTAVVPPAAAAAPVPFQPNVRAAIAVGAFTMLVPGVIGGFRTALGADDGQKTAGLLVAAGGFAMAPVLSHMVAREWSRAAVFGIVPTVTTIAATALVLEIPDAVYRGTTASRTGFGVLLGVGMLGSVLGLVDTALAGERARDRQRANEHGLFVVPAVSKDGAMLTLGGVL